MTTDLDGALDDLVEISRGIHPAILSQGGLTAALRALARRSSVPVELEAQIEGRLPDEVEVAAYYVAAEALTNVAKYACTSVVHMDVTADDGTLTLIIRDDGVGGADPGRGSGLIGLRGPRRGARRHDHDPQPEGKRHEPRRHPPNSNRHRTGERKRP